MATELKRFTDAYATMVVAVYEPLILRWFSGMGLWMIADLYSARAVAMKAVADKKAVTAGTMLKNRSAPLDFGRYLSGKGIDLNRLKESPEIFMSARTLTGSQRRALADFPNLEITTDAAYPFGRAEVIKGDKTERAENIPVMFTNSVKLGQKDFDTVKIRSSLFSNLSETFTKVAKKYDTIGAAEIRQMIAADVTSVMGMQNLSAGFDYLPITGFFFEALSPIGIAHFYRQLYFNLSEGVGPIEQAFTIAPAETLEVVYETIRRQTHEEVYEMGSETISETAVESKNVDEISDKVATMVQRDSGTAMTANAQMTASGGIGVWSASASASIGVNTSVKQSSQRSGEYATRRLKEVTTRASERIKKTFSLRVRDVEEVTTTNITRRIIKNESNAPVSYGLRRVFNRVKVKVQDLGPYLVWQLYLRNPGAGLARSRFVHFMESEPITSPVDPPAIRPRPTGGSDTGSTSATLAWSSANKTYFVSLVLHATRDRKITAVSIDSIADLEGGGKEDEAPSARNNIQWDQVYDTGTNTFSVKIGVAPGDSANVSVSYTYTFDPGDEVIAAWEDERRQAEDKFKKAELEARQKALQEQFERNKTLITERSKIKARPAADLRREERYEVMNRMVSHLFARGTDPAVPSPLEIEYFHRYFDIDAMFLYNHPSWWQPRYSPVKTGLARPAYEITADSEPARMGSSLGWLLQLDGDTRRNEFINSPWVRVCLPIRSNREREAIAWLAAHVEGEIGYDPKANPLKGLLEEIEQVRKDQESLGVNGPDYVTVSSTVGAPPGPLKPENIFPVIDEFEVTLPTEGFVYDQLLVTIP